MIIIGFFVGYRLCIFTCNLFTYLTLPLRFFTIIYEPVSKLCALLEAFMLYIFLSNNSDLIHAFFKTINRNPFGLYFCYRLFLDVTTLTTNIVFVFFCFRHPRTHVSNKLITQNLISTKSSINFPHLWVL